MPDGTKLIHVSLDAADFVVNRTLHTFASYGQAQHSYMKDIDQHAVPRRSIHEYFAHLSYCWPSTVREEHVRVVLLHRLNNDMTSHAMKTGDLWPQWSRNIPISPDLTVATLVFGVDFGWSSYGRDTPRLYIDFSCFRLAARVT